MNSTASRLFPVPAGKEKFTSSHENLLPTQYFENSKCVAELLYNYYIPKRISGERLARFSGEAYVDLACGFRPHFLCSWAEGTEDLPFDKKNRIQAISLLPPLRPSRRVVEGVVKEEILSPYEKWNPLGTLPVDVSEKEGQQEREILSGLYEDIGAYRTMVESEFTCEPDFTSKTVTRICYRNGATYVGELVNNKREGEGTLVFPGGGRYTGAFVNDCIQGNGHFSYCSGDVFEGSFDNFMKSGHGRLIYLNGDVYEGEFKEDLRNGTGKIIFSSGDNYEVVLSPWSSTSVVLISFLAYHSFVAG